MERGPKSKVQNGTDSMSTGMEPITIDDKKAAACFPVDFRRLEGIAGSIEQDCAKYKELRAAADARYIKECAELQRVFMNPQRKQQFDMNVEEINSKLQSLKTIEEQEDILWKGTDEEQLHPPHFPELDCMQEGPHPRKIAPVIEWVDPNEMSLEDYMAKKHEEDKQKGLEGVGTSTVSFAQAIEHVAKEDAKIEAGKSEPKENE